MMSSFIMNGVCVKWIGWLDLEALSGKARLVFDEERARVIRQILYWSPSFMKMQPYKQHLNFPMVYICGPIVPWFHCNCVNSVESY